ncbi:MAG TPA: prephenate dehydrogenase/arogenate dehydrogenase family protein [Bacteroidota bacterium]
MTVGVIGFGRFGRLAATLIAPHAPVVVHDPSPVRLPRGVRGMRRGSLAEAARAEIVLLATPVSALCEVLKRIHPLLAPGSLVADVCAVKVLPVRWMDRLLPADVTVLGTHPLFGPDSYAGTLAGHTVFLCPVRGRQAALTAAKDLLRRAGLTVRVIDPDRHDRLMAETVFLTQFVGRLVAAGGLGKGDEGTLHYRHLRSIATVARNDTVELFLDMWRYNPHAHRVAQQLGFGWKEVTRLLKGAGPLRPR